MIETTSIGDLIRQTGLHVPDDRWRLMEEYAVAHGDESGTRVEVRYVLRLGPHVHMWADESGYDHRERREVCTRCGEERTTPYDVDVDTPTE